MGEHTDTQAHRHTDTAEQTNAHMRATARKRACKMRTFAQALTHPCKQVSRTRPHTSAGAGVLQGIVCWETRALAVSPVGRRPAGKRDWKGRLYTSMRCWRTGWSLGALGGPLVSTKLKAAACQCVGASQSITHGGTTGSSCEKNMQTVGASQGIAWKLALGLDCR